MLKLLIAVDGSAHCLRAIEAVAQRVLHLVDLRVLLVK